MVPASGLCVSGLVGVEPTLPPAASPPTTKKYDTHRGRAPQGLRQRHLVALGKEAFLRDGVCNATAAGRQASKCNTALLPRALARWAWSDRVVAAGSETKDRVVSRLASECRLAQLRLAARGGLDLSRLSQGGLCRPQGTG